MSSAFLHMLLSDLAVVRTLGDDHRFCFPLHITLIHYFIIKSEFLQFVRMFGTILLYLLLSDTYVSDRG